ncbi:MAG: Ser-Thr-rich GPI-anchored membrane family protein [Bacteroidales bacterium]|jgi:hypothetical protein|nr:Ser-Thr-rich GPI-anchored membrane family protein [Bacteroidales bacterium]
MKKFFYVLSLFFLGFLLNGQQVFAQNPPNPVIELIQPDVSGIEWVYGETYMISWSDNFINGVDIILEDHTDPLNILSIPIKQNVSGSTYLWKINQAGITYPGSKFKIRVQSTVNGAYGDVSRKFFKILANSSDSFIKVEQPTVKGIKIQIGSQYLISWNHNVSGKFKIELVDENDNPVPGPAASNVIAAKVSGSTYTWNTTGWPERNDLRVLISSVDFPGVKDKSKKNFELSTSVGSITMLQPNDKNIVWQKGNKYLISWNDNLTEPVDIYLHDNTGVIRLIKKNVNGTTYVWDTKNDAPNDNLKIRVQSSLDANNYAESRHAFKLVQHTGTIKMEQPNVKHIEWVVGNTYLISWIDNVDAPLNIYLVSDAAPATYIPVKTGVVGSTYAWKIPKTTPLGDDYRIVVATADGSIEGASRHPFKLVDNIGEIDVLQPDVKGIEWVIGNKYLISWIDNVEGPVNIDLASASTVTIAEDNAGNYVTWNHGDNEGIGFGPWDITESSVGGGFTDNVIMDPAMGNILNMDNPSFGIIGWGNPASNDNNISVYREFSNALEVGQIFSFDWAVYYYNGNKGFSIYSGGESGDELIKVSIVSNDDILISHGANTTVMFDNPGTKVMNLKFEYLSSTELRVFGIGRDGSENFDQTFTISGAPDAIKFYSFGHSHNDFLKRINWFNNLKITKPGTVYDIFTPIATNVVGTTRIWNTAGFSPGTYKIRVSSGSIEDFSRYPFELVLSQGGNLSFNQPSAGDVWYKGYAYWIIWEDNIMESLDIYLKNDDLSPEVSKKLKSNFDGSMFDYTVPNNNSVPADINYYIEIVSSADPSLKFQSGLFTITDAIMMAVYPNPSSEYFNLRLDQQMEGMFDVIIYDRFNNRMIQTQVNAATKEHRINTAHLPNGIYFMQVTNGKTTITEKIVVKH